MFSLKVQWCWEVLSSIRKETSYSDRRLWCSHILIIIIIGGILVLFIYTRLASNEIFSPSDKTHREVGGAKDLSAPGNFYINVSVCSFSDPSALHLHQRLTPVILSTVLELEIAFTHKI